MKDYPTMQDWINSGVISAEIYKKELQHRMLHDMNLPCLKIKLLDGADFGNPKFKEEVENFLAKTNPTVFISSPKIKQGLKKAWIDNCKTWDQVEKFMNHLTDTKLYNVLLTEMVIGTEDTFIGTAISDGKGKVLMEFYKRPFWTDVRTISSGIAEPKYLDISYKKGGIFQIDPHKVSKEDVNIIYNQIKDKEGYFEYIQGIKNGVLSIYFMEFQDDAVFTKALKFIDNLKHNPFLKTKSI